jgi:hypothetical protein
MKKKRHLSERRNNKCHLFFGSPHQSFLRINTEKKGDIVKRKERMRGEEKQERER